MREETMAWPQGCRTHRLVSWMQVSAWPSWCKCSFPSRLYRNGNEIRFLRARPTRCRACVRRLGFLLYESAHVGNQSQATFNQARVVMQTKQRHLQPLNLATLGLAPLCSLACPHTPSNHATSVSQSWCWICHTRLQPTNGLCMSHKFPQPPPASSSSHLDIV